MYRHGSDWQRRIRQAFVLGVLPLTLVACAQAVPPVVAPRPQSVAAKCHRLIHQMQRLMALADAHLREARSSVNVPRIVCVGRAQQLIEAAVSDATAQHALFRKARAHGDQAQAQQALLNISVAHARVDVLHRQVSGCGGRAP